VRKFTRKPKKKEAKEEIVLVPQDYSPSDIPVEDRYRQYFLFWKSWQEELISALASSESHKKKISCLEEAIKNLESLRLLLYEEKQKDLDSYLSQLHRLKEEVTQDIYGTNSMRHKAEAESLKRNILRDFSYPKVKGHLR
jgi:tRNA uridine 5-carbamoylmethylation protein Kti12